MIIRNLFAVFVVTLLTCTVYKDVSSKLVGQHTGIWAVKFKYSSSKTYQQMAEEFAHQHGLANRGVVGVLRDTYEFALPDNEVVLLHNREVMDQYKLRLSRESGHVAWSEYQRPLRRVPRGVTFNDPKYGRQWHLVCSVTIANHLVYFKEAPTLHISKLQFIAWVTLHKNKIPAIVCV